MSSMQLFVKDFLGDKSTTFSVTGSNPQSGGLLETAHVCSSKERDSRLPWTRSNWRNVGRENRLTIYKEIYAKERAAGKACALTAKRHLL